MRIPYDLLEEVHSDHPPLECVVAVTQAEASGGCDKHLQYVYDREAKRLLRGLGSDLHLLPGPQRLELLRHANLLLDLQERSAPPARRRRSG